MFAQAIETLLTRHCTPAQVRAMEAGGSTQQLAAAIEAAGFHDLLAPEQRGGGGASWHDLHEVVALCGAYAVPLPLPQTLAARSVAVDLSALAPGLITFAPALHRDQGGALQATHVPFARTAAHVIGAVGEHLVLLDLVHAQQLPGGVHRSLAASLRWPAGSGKVLASEFDAQGLQALGALLHAGLMAGAMKRAFELTLAHANTRVQFGKAIGSFQAIQHQLSVMAEHVAASRMAVEAAFAGARACPALLACAVAKARTSEAAQLVASIAHAVHGAMGVTEACDLQLYTRRLHEWRMAHGSEAHWHEMLGHHLANSREPLAADFVRALD